MKRTPLLKLRIRKARFNIKADLVRKHVADLHARMLTTDAVLLDLDEVGRALAAQVEKSATEIERVADVLGTRGLIDLSDDLRLEAQALRKTNNE